MPKRRLSARRRRRNPSLPHFLSALAETHLVAHLRCEVPVIEPALPRTRPLPRTARSGPFARSLRAAAAQKAHKADRQTDRKRLKGALIARLL
jgi:hypothetical protein